jgi:hypothetical protein
MADRPEAFIQWKNTDSCIDLFCACGQQFHYDGYFAYELTCGKCGQTCELPSRVAVTPVKPTRQPIIVFDEQEVIREGEFEFTWPRAAFDVEPGGIFTICDEPDHCHRAAYVDLISATSRGDGTTTVRVCYRGPA